MRSSFLGVQELIHFGIEKNSKHVFKLLITGNARAHTDFAVFFRSQVLCPQKTFPKNDHTVF